MAPAWKEHNQHAATVPRRLGIDLGSALVAGMSIAPVVSVIDRAVTESVSGRASLWGSIRSSLHTALTRPHRFIFGKPLAIMLMLYGSTYFAANVVDTATAAAKGLPVGTVSAGMPKFLATSAVNLNLSLLKDIQYAKMFGVTAPAAFPPASYAIFIVRDCMTIAASFNLPPRLIKYLPPGMDEYLSRATAAQLAAPVMVQIVGAPLHLLGLDLYNRNHRLSKADRWAKVKEAWPRTAMARMCRVLPAFGVGGVINARIRQRLLQQV